MYSYLKAYMEKGIYKRENALKLVRDFFLSFNKDSDIYVVFSRVIRARAWHRVY